jgi:hypothetical protein
LKHNKAFAAERKKRAPAEKQRYVLPTMSLTEHTMNKIYIIIPAIFLCLLIGIFALETEKDSEMNLKSAEEVAKRILSLIAVTERVYEQPPETIRKWVDHFKISQYFTPEENYFFFSETITEDQKAFFSWKAEAMVPLIWALNGCEKLLPLNEKVDLSKYKMIHNALDNPELFIQSAKLRDKQEIIDAESDLYHQHWRVRDADLFDKPMPKELNPGIVYERRYGASWLVGWGDDWDNVPTDT